MGYLVHRFRLGYQNGDVGVGGSGGRSPVTGWNKPDCLPPASNSTAGKTWN